MSDASKDASTFIPENPLLLSLGVELTHHLDVLLYRQQARRSGPNDVAEAPFAHFTGGDALRSSRRS